MTTNTRSKVSRGSLQKESLIQAQAEKVEMTLNTDSAIASGLLIQRLTELYEDPVEASVRETVSNALDAVMESHSGETPEIHISSPTSLNPIFTVRDNGVGMTYDDLKEIYSKYGASTKMSNFDQIGAYGLGAKAPLAYGTEFTVSSVKDGQRTTIIVAREELTNYIKIVDSVETDAPSGTTVSIPVSNYDIERFQSHINKYKENPVDKDNVKMFVDEEEINKDGDYLQVSDDMVIFQNDEEVITGRLWVKKDGNTIVNIIANMSEDDIRRSLQYLIGGWAYSSPSRRGSYYRNNNGLVVELKAGIVGFNSSRDAILENERYNALEELVIKYVKSEEFMSNLTKAVNSLDLESFKSIVINLLKQDERQIRIVDKKIKVEEAPRSYYSRQISRRYSISEFVHNETGFRFDNMLKGIPTERKQTAAIMESKVAYRKTAYSSILGAHDIVGEEISHRRFKSENVSDIIRDVDNIMYGSLDTHSLESLMLNLALLAYSGQDKNMRITFITDIKADINEAEKTTDYSRLRSGRKTIVRMRNEGKESEEYSSYLIYTEHSKAVIEKMLKEAKFDDLDILVETAEKMVEKMNEYRKANRTASSRTVNNSLSTTLKKFDIDSNTSRHILVDEIEVEDDKVNIILVTKDGYVRDNEMKMVHAWYCNENDLMPEEVQLYSSVGQHRVVDVEILSELGELYENPRSRYAGNSKLYSEVVGNNVAKMHIINNGEKDIEKKSFIRFLSSMIMTSPSSVMERITAELKRAEEIAKTAGFELTEIPTEMLEELGVYGDNEFGTTYSGSYWSTEYSASQHLLKNIGKDKYELIENLVSLESSSNILIGEDGEFTTKYYNGLSMPNRSQVELAYQEENANRSFYKMVRLQVKAYLEHIENIIEGLSTIKF